MASKDGASTTAVVLGGADSASAAEPRLSSFTGLPATATVPPLPPGPPSGVFTPFSPWGQAATAAAWAATLQTRDPANGIPGRHCLPGPLDAPGADKEVSSFLESHKINRAHLAAADNAQCLHRDPSLYAKRTRRVDHSDPGRTHPTYTTFLLHDFLHECCQYLQRQAAVGQQNVGLTGAVVGEQDRYESRTQLAVHQFGQFKRRTVVPYRVVVRP